MAWFLETARLGLRRFEPRDLDDIAALDADPLVMEHINGGVPVERERIERDFGPKLVEAWDPLCTATKRTFFAACLKATGEFVGWFHSKPGAFWPDEMELGYRLKRSVWGRGLATEGSIALRDFTFDRLGERKYIAITMLGNVKSQRVMQKIGMTLECEYVETRWPGPDRRALKFAVMRDAERRTTGCDSSVV